MVREVLLVFLLYSTTFMLIILVAFLPARARTIYVDDDRMQYPSAVIAINTSTGQVTTGGVGTATITATNRTVSGGSKITLNPDPTLPTGRRPR